MILDTTLKALKFKLAGAITTNQLVFTTDYYDTDETNDIVTAVEGDGVSNNTTAVTLVAAPASGYKRLIRWLSIQNKDTAAATVTIYIDNNGTERDVFIATLDSGDNLFFSDETFYVLNSIGSPKNIGVGSVSTASNVGSGAGWWKDLSGTVLRFKSIIMGSSKLALTNNTNDLTIDVAEANLTISNMGGTLLTTHGGTGLTSYTSGDLPYYAAGTLLSKLAIGSTNQILTVVGGVPTWQNAATSGAATGTGTTNHFTKWSSSTVITDARWLDDGTNVYVGTTSPAALLHLASNSAWTSMLSTHVASAVSSVLTFRKSRGTNASPSGVSTSDVLGTIASSAYGTSAYYDTAKITFVYGSYGDISAGGGAASGTPQSSIGFYTNGIGFAPSIAVAIDSTGDVYLTTAIKGGAWNATSIQATYGGTGLNTYATGDILYAGSTNPVALTKRTIGSTGQVLTVAGGVPTWAAAVGFSNPMTTKGDLILGDTAGSPIRLAIGANTYILTSDGTTASWAAPANNGANPSTSIGLSIVNGSATTYMRSDGAPALSQAISPTWTGVHTFSIVDNQLIGFKITESSNVYLTVKTTNAAESIVFGNSTTNPLFTFNGTGLASFAGAVTVTGTLTAATYAGSSSIATVGTITSGTLGAGAVVAGVTMTLGSDATGDIYYRESTGILTRLAIGSSGQILNVASGKPAWVTGGTGTVTGTGTSGKMTKWTGTSSIGNSILLDDGTSVYTGTTTPEAILHVVAASAFLALFRVHSATAATGSVLRLSRSRGTDASPTVITNGDIIGTLQSETYPGTAFYDTSKIEFYSDGAITNNQRPPTGIKLYTNAANTAVTLALTINSSQNATFAGTLAASNLSGTNTGDQTITLTGDVTGSGTGSFATTIANDAVTTVKILNSNVTLAKIANIADQTILGNNTGGSAAPVALTASQTKTVLSLNLVENTALSTWAGSTNLVTLGTITTGTWSATTIAINKGGTGQTTATAAFNALSPITTRGDIITGGIAGINQRLALGTSGYFLSSDGTDAVWAAVPAGVVGANPSATIGLTAVNGSATTYLRSDGAPALDQSIAPTWTGVHLFSLPDNTTIAWEALEGTNVYIKIKTTNAAESIVFGNATTNPIYSFLGSGAVAITGSVSASNLSGTNTGDQTITLTGDVTGSGTGSFAATIANDAVITAKILNSNVTYAKIQNVSATSRILGRITAGAGVIEELTGTNVRTITGLGTGDNVVFNQVTAALVGNASTATALATGRTINGTTFDGTTNITVTAAAGTLTGTTLNGTVVTTSITSTGTMTSGTLSTGYVVAGVTMTLGSDATGDIYYRESTGVLTRLAIGSAAQVLTVSSGKPAWAASGGGVSAASVWAAVLAFL